MSCKDLFKWIFEFDIYIEILVKPTRKMSHQKITLDKYIFLSHVPISNLLQTKYLALYSIL